MLSVCPSVTFKYRDHIGWKTSKIISLLISLRCVLGDPKMGNLVQREHSQNKGGTGLEEWSHEHKNLQYLRNGVR